MGPVYAGRRFNEPGTSGLSLQLVVMVGAGLFFIIAHPFGRISHNNMDIMIAISAYDVIAIGRKSEKPAKLKSTTKF
jgi:hypothetical protein